ncbi:MAG: hypothetical protein HOV68_30595 [Streptomycetaceae bacterium]|nr:hypothetical protein [Streptomycetaceae bacterium]
MAFRPLPAVSLIDASGDVPSAEDFAQLLKVHGTEQPPPAAVQADPARPLVLTGRPVTVAVVGPHRGTAGLGGVGRSSTAVGIARALAQRGLRVLVADADPYGRLVQTLELQPVPNLEATAAASPSGPRLEDLRAAAADARFDVVLLDGGPSEQRVLAEVADRWIGVSALWPNRSGHPFLGEQVVGRTGMPLPDGWDAAWLSTMRANRWTVRWRLAPLAFDAGFAAFDADGCAGVVPVGERTEPGARAVDFLSGLRTRLPVLPAVPFAPRGGDESSGADAYDRIAAVLLASTPVR